MEKSRVKVESFLLVCLTLGLIVGQSTAYNKICYRVCFVCCMIGSESGMEACVALCKKLCSGYLPAGTSSTQTPVPTSFNVTPITDSQYFCTFGCSTVLCTNLSTKDNPAAVGKMELGCVDSCSRTCTQKSLSPSKND